VADGSFSDSLDSSIADVNQARCGTTKIKMDDQTRTISKQLYNALLAYLIQSSTALDNTIKGLATGAVVSSLALNVTPPKSS
jgi:hypothetical protein